MPWPRANPPRGGGRGGPHGQPGRSPAQHGAELHRGAQEIRQCGSRDAGNLARTEVLRGELPALVDKDAEAFGAVCGLLLHAQRDRRRESSPTAAMQAGMKGAMMVPFWVAEKCLELLRLAEPVGAKGNSTVVSDAATSLYLAPGRGTQWTDQRGYQSEIHQRQRICGRVDGQSCRPAGCGCRCLLRGNRCLFRHTGGECIGAQLLYGKALSKTMLGNLKSQFAVRRSFALR